jgi:hypothetical protein
MNSPRRFGMEGKDRERWANCKGHDFRNQVVPEINAQMLGGASRKSPRSIRRVCLYCGMPEEKYLEEQGGQTSSG